MQVNEWACLIMLLGASYTDLKYTKIKNIWIVLFLLFGVLFYRLSFLTHVLLVLLIMFPLYYIRVIGAGDLKLVSLMIGYMKVDHSLKIIYIGLIFAGIYSVYKMFTRNLLKERMLYFAQYVGAFFATGRIGRYSSDHTLKSGAIIPLAPFLLLGFLTWRAFLLWKMQV